MEQGRRRAQWFGSWGDAGAPQQRSPHVAARNRPAPRGHRGRAGCALPYHGDVVAGVEEDGEVGLLQAFLQSLQPLHHLIRVIPGKPCVQRQRSVRSLPQVLHPKRCRALGFACSWLGFQGGAEEPRLLPRPRGAALQGPAARNHSTEPKPPRHRTLLPLECLRSQHRKGRTDLSRREEETQAEFGSGTCSSCAPAFPRAFNTQTNASPSPMRPPPHCRPPCSDRHSQVPPAQRMGSTPPAHAPTFVAQLDVEQAVDAVHRVLADAGQGVGAARGEEGDQHAEVVEGDHGLRGDNRGRAGVGEHRATASGCREPSTHPRRGTRPIPARLEGSGEGMLEHRGHLR